MPMEKRDFSDEKVFQLTKREERLGVYRRSNERFAHPCIQVIGERRTIMVLGAISTEGKSVLVRMNGNINALSYQQQALQPGLMPFLNTHDRQMKSVDDGARPHTDNKRLVGDEQRAGVWALAG